MPSRNSSGQPSSRCSVTSVSRLNIGPHTVSETRLTLGLACRSQASHSPACLQQFNQCAISASVRTKQHAQHMTRPSDSNLVIMPSRSPMICGERLCASQHKFCSICSGTSFQRLSGSSLRTASNVKSSFFQSSSPAALRCGCRHKMLQGCESCLLASAANPWAIEWHRPAHG